MICKVEKTIEKYALLKGVKTVAVGVSGGADSMCLLHILSCLKDKYGIILKVVHINHNLRGEEANSDERAVKDYCEKTGLSFKCFSVDVSSLAKKSGLSLEECGRDVRYSCFGQMNCDAVAVAHTLSDSIETMLFNLARGTGTKGLCGIPPKREPNIIRPLIECTRSEVEQYISDNSIPFVTDFTNLQDDYTRNFIRHNIVPFFAEVNSDFEKGFLKAMSILRSENDFIEETVSEVLSKAQKGDTYITGVLRNAHPSIRQRAIRYIIEPILQKSVEKRHVDLTEKAIIKGCGKIELAKNLYICVNGDIISIQHQQKTGDEPWESKLSGRCFYTPYGKFSLEVIESAEKLTNNDIDLTKIKGKLVLSSRKQGDCFFSKKRANTKTLKKLFCEMKIPPAKRNSIAVLRDEKGVVWVEGIGTDGKYLPEKKEKVLRIKKEG